MELTRITGETLVSSYPDIQNSNMSKVEQADTARGEQIEANASDIAELEEKLAGTKDSALKTKITTLESQMAGTATSALKTALDSQQEQIANLGLSVVNGELSITYNV